MSGLCMNVFITIFWINQSAGQSNLCCCKNRLNRGFISKEGGCRTVVAGGVVFGEHAGGVVQWRTPTGPVDPLCLGPDDLFGGSIVVRNKLPTQRREFFTDWVNAFSHFSVSFSVVVGRASWLCIKLKAQLDSSSSFQLFNWDLYCLKSSRPCGAACPAASSEQANSNGFFLSRNLSQQRSKNSSINMWNYIVRPVSQFLPMDQPNSFSLVL